MIEVEIKNFQSIEHTRVRVEGFTALVGKSNIGKSAIVRAIKAALTGAADDNFVRHGSTCKRETKGTKKCECYCSVHLTTEGIDLLWEKGDSRNYYKFNGTDYTALGKGTPDFLEKGFGLVKVGDSRIMLQVADQFRHEGGGPIFLLDEPGSTAADVLSDVAQLDRINVATKLSEKDRREAVAQRKVREKDVMDLRLQLAGYDGLDAALVQVREVEAVEARIQTARVERDRLEHWRTGATTVSRQIKALSPVVALEPPDARALSDARRRFQALGSQLVAMGGRQAYLASLDRLGDVSEPPPIAPVQAALGGFQRLSGWLSVLRRHKDLFARWKDVESAQMPDAEALGKARRAADALGMMRRHTALLESKARLEATLAQLDAEYEKISSEIDELGVCPTCAQPVSPVVHTHA